MGAKAVKRVLMVAYHFPPLAGSSGVQRCLRFAQYLPDFGWEPIVLTAHERAYERVSNDLNAQIAQGMLVRRAQAFDAARHFAIAGRYPAALACPDRWASWKFDAVRQGMALIRSHRPDVLWSTFPIATAHTIGAELQRRSGLPWVADFRDPMAQDGYPADARIWRAYDAIERRTIAGAAACTFTSPSAARTYGARYPEAAPRIGVIENGYDEESFAGLLADGHAPLNPGSLTLLHSGIVYPSERDPTQLFAALRLLGPAAQRLRLRFRGAAHDDLVRRLADEQGVGALVETLPPIAYNEALREMLRADALLVLQASNCNEQIPAKLYEYLRCGRPILGLCDPVGDTAATLRQAGLHAIAPLDDAAQIAAALQRFIDGGASARDARPDPAVVAAASRRGRTAALAGLLDRLAR
ncbi:MAG: glycosyltransferase [Burkholderiaceae bacterium]|nr:glycosyltransferase [Burkholderiaceae bacterium]